MINKYKAKTYCCEDISLIENYAEAVASPERWECHHRAEVLPCGNFTPDDLIRFGLYKNRPAAELIFMTEFDHKSLHHSGERHYLYGKHQPEEIRQKNIHAHIGEKNHFYGKHHTEESKKLMSEKRKGMLAGVNNPMYGMSGEKAPAYGTHWYNDGKTAVQAKTCPEGFVPGNLFSAGKNNYCYGRTGEKTPSIRDALVHRRREKRNGKDLSLRFSSRTNEETAPER